jgi:hypothetical protein
MKVMKMSYLTGKIHTLDIPVTHKQLIRYENGNESVHDVFPNLSRAHREFIMSGIPPEERKLTSARQKKGKE